MIFAELILALGCLTLSGAGVLSLLFRRRFPATLLSFLGLSFLTGFGLVGLTSVLWMVAGGTVTPLLLFGWGGTGLLLLLRNRPSFSPSPATGLWERIGMGWIGAALLFSLGGALYREGLGWDANSFWSLKAASIARHGTYQNPDFTSPIRPHMHPRYPLLVPSVHAAIHQVTGSTEEMPVRVTMFCFYAASLGLLASLLRERLSGPFSIGITAAFAWMPVVQSGETGGAGGFCDYPLAFFLLIALVHAERWLSTGEARSALLSALFLGFASQTKEEGGAMAAMALALLPLFGFLARRGKGAWGGIGIALPGAIFFALWLFARRTLLEDESRTDLTAVEWSRLPEILRLLASHMLRFTEWGILWPAIFFVALRRPPGRREPESLLPAFVLTMMLLYVGVWMVHPGAQTKDVMIHNRKRLLLQLMPVCLVWAARRLSPAAPSSLGSPASSRKETKPVLSGFIE